MYRRLGEPALGPTWETVPEERNAVVRDSRIGGDGAVHPAYHGSIGGAVEVRREGPAVSLNIDVGRPDAIAQTHLHVEAPSHLPTILRIEFVLGDSEVVVSILFVLREGLE